MKEKTIDPFIGYSLEEELELFKTLEERRREAVDSKVVCVTAKEFLSNLREEVASA